MFSGARNAMKLFSNCLMQAEVTNPRGRLINSEIISRWNCAALCYTQAEIWVFSVYEPTSGIYDIPCITQYWKYISAIAKLPKPKNMGVALEIVQLRGIRTDWGIRIPSSGAALLDFWLSLSLHTGWDIIPSLWVAILNSRLPLATNNKQNSSMEFLDF